MKSIKDVIEVLVESILCVIAFVTIIWLLNLFDCLSGKQYEIIITFLGVIATFVVINNFHQVGKIKELAIDEINKLEQKQKLIEELILSSKEYIVASKIVAQNHLAKHKKAIWSISVKSIRVQGNWEETLGVKIKSVSLDDNGEIIWSFTDIDDQEQSYLNNRVLVSIDEDTLDIEPHICYFDSPTFMNYLRILLKRDNDNI